MVKYRSATISDAAADEIGDLQTTPEGANLLSSFDRLVYYVIAQLDPEYNIEKEVKLLKDVSYLRHFLYRLLNPDEDEDENEILPEARDILKHKHQINNK